jgi:hypothetical protein
MTGGIAADDPRAPKYWMHETGGELVPAVQQFLEAREPLTIRQLSLLRAYFVQWIDSPVWDQNPTLDGPGRQELALLRHTARRIDSEHSARAWSRAAFTAGLDPL